MRPAIRRSPYLVLLVAYGCSGTPTPTDANTGDVDASRDASDASDAQSVTDAPDAGADSATAELPACPVVARSGTDATLPSAFVDTREVTPTGRTLSVTAGMDLQAAIDSAQPGDVLELAAGAEFTGNFTLPEKTGEGWIVIRSSGALPPAGTRVTPANAGVMARIVTPNTLPAVQTAARAHHYRFVGIEFRPAPGQDVNDLVVLGSGSATSESELAHHIVIDRCYIHADPVGGKRGVQLNASHVGIVDSYISGWRRVGQDTQALLGWNAPGPYRIVNNYLEGAGENLMFGGADAVIPNVIPSDIEICRNHFSKPRTWKMDDPMFDGTAWSVKNLLELKVGRRVLIAGNVFEQVWPMAQVGFALVIKTSNQDGGEPWATTEDVTVAYNIVRRAAQGAAISNGEGGGPTMGTHRVRFVNNLMTEIGVGDWSGSDGRLFQVLGVPGVHLDHNTGFGVNQTVMFDGAANDDFVFTNNVCGDTMYGVFGSGAGEGNGALAMYAPSAMFARTVMIGRAVASYPADNFFPANAAAVGFVDAASGDYALAPTSTYRAMGTDGRDPGADVTAVRMATAGVAR